MAHTATVARRRRQGGGLLARALVPALGAAAIALAVSAVAYVVWPAPAPLSPDAPALPITVGNVLFNVPAAAIRFKAQRRSGDQARIDLSFVWPSLTPPDPNAKPKPSDTPDVTDRLFMTIAASDNTLAPMERLKTIYPRYLDGTPVVGTDGLSRQSFRDNSAYKGDELIFDPAAQERFLLRCARQAGVTPAMCLHERRIAGADLMLRFPRAWLGDWRTTASRIERLIASLHPSPMAN
ncbi:hypothetical protein [Pseudorhodoplanes sp.]|jgi:hypothetical protein|uniref:hypothetical protein n=1 Tax=Pseudorhodoplanes sp. TaxID=1934341 RepID=UPI002B8EA866|nr:hypothetical protein [Pseudorhodoplanes sp.]HWV40124.1 hypothetical protein [Pseudorhodoplanes sp.]